MGSAERPFRVIVVGGGVGGLTAAHTLHRAGIDYVVLEKGLVAPPMGASIGIYPHGSRILEQIGCLADVEDECVTLGKSQNLLPDGRTIFSSDFFKYSRQYHGYPIPVLERRRFLEILYENTPDKSKIRSGTAVVDVIDHETGVKAILADGSVEEGDLVLGVDGVHSNIRNIMWRNANAAVPGLITTAEKKSLICDWTALAGFSPTVPGMSNCNMTCTHYPGKSFLVIGQKKYTFWFVFFKNEETRYWPSSPRWTAQDAEKRAAECADCPISDTQVFGELWRSRVRGDLVNVEEGLFKHMYFGRIVLAGDAVHKMTPNIGLGGNASMESVVVLSNLLHRAVQAHPSGKPDKKMLETILEEYQTLRYDRMQKVIHFSGEATRLQAWDSLYYKTLSRVIPYFPDTTSAKRTAELIKAAAKLDYVPTSPARKGTVAWEDDGQRALGAHQAAVSSVRRLIQIPVVLLSFGLSFFYLSGIKL
ncbi:FAD-dependent oxidoreductase [Aspergillus melleus]|uniref:FAD-dependent oxidoreductase n=1 Tax=Aspergillus melleus TaxID=138277 RepID=UPI001E8EE6B4|nr:uncharacterized protein LDX57_006900 [Aspergillus melleus]KAH8429233.1 hypothetical protein LDX57_006900 [Aspergillus melleus]